MAGRGVTDVMGGTVPALKLVESQGIESQQAPSYTGHLLQKYGQGLLVLINKVAHLKELLEGRHILLQVRYQDPLSRRPTQQWWVHLTCVSC